MASKALGELLNPRLSPALYILAFFLAVPLLVYGVMQTSLQEGGAAVGGDASVDFSNVQTGQSVDEDDTMSIKVGYDAGECVSTLNVTDGLESIYSSTISDSGTLSFNYTFDTPGQVNLVASLVPMSGQSGVCAQSRYDEAVLTVIPSEMNAYWVDPQHMDTLSGSKRLFWEVSGVDLANTSYKLSLSTISPSVAGEVWEEQGMLSSRCAPDLLAAAAYRCTSAELLDTTEHENGNYTLKVELSTISAIEEQGVLASSDTITVIINNANAAPTCTLSVSPSTVDSGSAVAVSAHATDPDDTLENGTVNFGDGVKADISPNGATVSHIYTNPGSTSKDYILKALFKDPHGAMGVCSATVTVRGVTNPPAPNHAPVFSSTPSTKAVVGETYTYTLTATDADGDSLSYGWSKKPSWLSWSASSNVYKLSGTPVLTDANKTFKVSVYVSDGEATTTQTYIITVVGEVAGVSSEPPVVTIVYPTAGAQLGCGHSKIKWEATDADGTIASIKLEYSTDEENWTVIAEEIDGTETSYDWDVCSLTYGTYFVMVTALDDTGVPGADQSEAFSIVDPALILTGPEIINWKPESNSTVSSDKPTISAEFVATTAGIEESSVLVQVDEEDITSMATVSVNGFSYVPSEALENGEHTVSVSVSDVDGRTSELTYTFIVSAGPAGLTWTAWSAIICGFLAIIALIIAWIWKRMNDKAEKAPKKKAGK